MSQNGNNIACANAALSMANATTIRIISNEFHCLLLKAQNTINSIVIQYNKQLKRMYDEQNLFQQRLRNDDQNEPKMEGSIDFETNMSIECENIAKLVDYYDKNAYIVEAINTIATLELYNDSSNNNNNSNDEIIYDSDDTGMSDSIDNCIKHEMTTNGNSNSNNNYDSDSDNNNENKQEFDENYFSDIDAFEQKNSGQLKMKIENENEMEIETNENNELTRMIDTTDDSSDINGNNDKSQSLLNSNDMSDNDTESESENDSDSDSDSEYSSIDSEDDDDDSSVDSEDDEMTISAIGKRAWIEQSKNEMVANNQNNNENEESNDNYNYKAQKKKKKKNNNSNDKRNFKGKKTWGTDEIGFLNQIWEDEYKELYWQCKGIKPKKDDSKITLGVKSIMREMSNKFKQNGFIREWLPIYAQLQKLGEIEPQDWSKSKSDNNPRYRKTSDSHSIWTETEDNMLNKQLFEPTNENKASFSNQYNNRMLTKKDIGRQIAKLFKNKAFNRTPGAILARIKHLNLDEKLTKKPRKEKKEKQNRNRKSITEKSSNNAYINMSSHVASTHRVPVNGRSNNSQKKRRYEHCQLKHNNKQSECNDSNNNINNNMDQYNESSDDETDSQYNVSVSPLTNENLIDNLEETGIGEPPKKRRKISRQ